MKKRDFIKQLGGAALFSPFLGMPQNHFSSTHKPYPLAEDAFWERIREDYELKPDYINLENGYYNFIPKPTLEKYLEHLKMVNYEASYYMRTVQWENKDRVRNRLASFVGASPR
ncbi:hypothetical protein NYZ99_17585 [Maribacter litopenaei]|uniref:Uncharacterized protein n=1 Tax=Maribacter litopenaei TaxID=2976127 RepID=A0ABY5Y924_9FLAO|nr:hypothetical protein [Maribacter litopenaei]UWX54650.1 hypothetical protein NYZ99_17585 [Maribacter litopenaei]